MTCQLRLDDGGPCGQPTTGSPEPGCCLLHSSDRERKDPDTFLSLLAGWPWQNRRLDRAVFPATCLFDSRRLSSAAGDLVLNRCDIGQLEIGSETPPVLCAVAVQLHECRLGSLTLRNVDFRGRVRLIRCEVREGLTAEGCSFPENLEVEDCWLDSMSLQLGRSRRVLVSRSWLGSLEISTPDTVEDVSLVQVAGGSLTCREPSSLGSLTIFGEDTVKIEGVEGWIGARSFVGGSFEECDLSALEAQRIEIAGCSLGNANLEKLVVASSFKIQGNERTKRSTFEPANLEGARFRGKLSWRGTGKDPIFAATEESSLQQAQFHEDIDAVLHSVSLERCRLKGCDLRNIRLIGIRFPRRMGRFAVYDETDRKPETVTEELQGLYRSLQSNYEARNEFGLAGNFRVAYWDVKRLDGGGFKEDWQWLYRSFSIIAIYNTFSRYGEDYRRTIAWIGGVILAAAIVFLATGFQAAHPLDSGPRLIRYSFAPTAEGVSDLASQRFVKDLWIASYSSLLVFSLQRQEGFWPATHLGEAVMFCEQLLAPILVAMLVLAIQRRFKQ